VKRHLWNAPSNGVLQGIAVENLNWLVWLLFSGQQGTFWFWLEQIFSLVYNLFFEFLRAILTVFHMTFRGCTF
jgi:hypothetical protein